MLPESDPRAWHPSYARSLNHHQPQPGDPYPIGTLGELPRGATLVVTEQMRMLAATMPTAVGRGAIIVISGPAGSGKSITASAVCAAATVPVAYADIQPHSNAKDTFAQVAYALTGTLHNATTSQLRLFCRNYLTVNPTLLVVDEAHNVGRKTLVNLRWLTALAMHGFALMLVGVGLDEIVAREEQLDTRVSRRILLDSLPTQRLIPMLREFHPVLDSMDDALLTKTDHAFARGRWRNWAELVKTLANDKQLTHATEHDVRLALTSITGRIPW